MFNKLLIIITVLITSAVASFAYEASGNGGRKFTLIIDAGHGGKDVGAAENGAREKDINLGVALELGKLVSKRMKDAKLVMTRDDDTYLTLQERADIANKAKGDLFISIHTNSVDRKNRNRASVSGSSVYALGLHKDENNMKVAQRENAVIELEQNYAQKYSGFDPQKDESYIIFEMAQKKNLTKSIKFAEDAQKHLVDAGRHNRGVHQAGFWVLWATSMPSVLVELDFICNPLSAKYLVSEKGQKELAEALYKAVESFRDSWSRSFEKSAVGELTMTTPLVSTGDGKLVRTSSKVAVKKNDPVPPTSERTGYYSGQRKRRSVQAKQVSSQRNVETASIPEHSQNERLGVVEDLEHNENKLRNPQPQVKELSSKEKKKREKEEKERKKLGEKSEGKNKKTERSASAHNAKVDKFVKIYKIQILASNDLLKENNPRFCGLKPVTVYRDNNMYKYYYGESRDQEDMEKLLKEVREKIPDAFIVSSFKSLKK